MEDPFAPPRHSPNLGWLGQLRAAASAGLATILRTDDVRWIEEADARWDEGDLASALAALGRVRFVSDDIVAMRVLLATECGLAHLPATVSPEESALEDALLDAATDVDPSPIVGTLPAGPHARLGALFVAAALAATDPGAARAALARTGWTGDRLSTFVTLFSAYGIPERLAVLEAAED